jgi:hypothetical protein
MAALLSIAAVAQLIARPAIGVQGDALTADWPSRVRPIGRMTVTAGPARPAPAGAQSIARR